MPLLWYSVVTNWLNGAWNWWHILFLIIAVCADLNSEKHAAKQKRA
jgi:hypothetical protein